MPDTRLNTYRRARNLTFEALGECIEVRRQTANRYCLPVDAGDHRRPGREASERLKALTFGVIHAGNYADLITEDEAARMMEDIKAREIAAVEAWEARA